MFPISSVTHHYDKRLIRTSFTKEKPKARDVYRMALQGYTGAEIRKRLLPKLAKSVWHYGYMHLVMEARKLNPSAAARVEAVAQHHRTKTGRGETALGLDITELRRVARTTAPDTIIAVHFGVDVAELRKHYRRVIDEERAQLGLKIATSYVERALGTPEVKKGERVVKAAVPPDMVLGEKLLHRIGFMEAPLESELNVHVHFDAPPKLEPKDVGKGKKALIDLGDD